MDGGGAIREKPAQRWSRKIDQDENEEQKIYREE